MYWTEVHALNLIFYLSWPRPGRFGTIFFRRGAGTMPRLSLLLLAMAIFASSASAQDERFSDPKFMPKRGQLASGPVAGTAAPTAAITAPSISFSPVQKNGVDTRPAARR